MEVEKIPIYFWEFFPSKTNFCNTHGSVKQNI